MADEPNAVNAYLKAKHTGQGDMNTPGVGAGLAEYRAKRSEQFVEMASAPAKGMASGQAAADALGPIIWFFRRPIAFLAYALSAGVVCGYVGELLGLGASFDKLPMWYVNLCTVIAIGAGFLLWKKARKMFLWLTALGSLGSIAIIALT